MNIAPSTWSKVQHQWLETIGFHNRLLTSRVVFNNCAYHICRLCPDNWRIPLKAESQTFVIHEESSQLVALPPSTREWLRLRDCYKTRSIEKGDEKLRQILEDRIKAISFHVRRRSLSCWRGEQALGFIHYGSRITFLAWTSSC